MAATEREEQALQAPLGVIAARDRPAALRLIAESPSLARAAIRVGASRRGGNAHFFSEITHYAYAGDTALHIAAAAYQPDIAKDLASRGADVSARNRRGAEPLRYATDGIPGSRSWDPDAPHAVIAFLVGAGANPNAVDKSGVAPIHRAVRTRCAAAVRALIVNGADPLRRNKSGSTPLHLAVQSTGRGGTGSTAARDEQADIIRLLLGAGARPSDRDSVGRSVRDCATIDWVRALLTRP